MDRKLATVNLCLAAVGLENSAAVFLFLNSQVFPSLQVDLSPLKPPYLIGPQNCVWCAVWLTPYM
jgi:hypothetical protein